MNWRSLGVSIFLAALILAQGAVVQAPVPERPLIGKVPNQQRGPSFSSPQESMAPNGDRVSHYPPYYHPENSGGRH
jgi:hypothetical protein